MLLGLLGGLQSLNQMQSIISESSSLPPMRVQDSVDFASVQRLVEPLNLPRQHYVLFGSLPLLAYRLIDRVNDIDILADNLGWQYAKTLSSISISAKGHEVIQLGDIEIYNEWMDIDVAQVISQAVFIEGLPFARLEDVLHYKQILNRPKDQEHIRLIQELSSNLIVNHNRCNYRRKKALYKYRGECAVLGEALCNELII